MYTIIRAIQVQLLELLQTDRLSSWWSELLPCSKKVFSQSLFIVIPHLSICFLTLSLHVSLFAMYPVTWSFNQNTVGCFWTQSIISSQLSTEWMNCLCRESMLKTPSLFLCILIFFFLPFNLFPTYPTLCNSSCCCLRHSHILNCGPVELEITLHNDVRWGRASNGNLVILCKLLSWRDRTRVKAFTCLAWTDPKVILSSTWFPEKWVSYMHIWKFNVYIFPVPKDLDIYGKYYQEDLGSRSIMDLVWLHQR